MDDAEFFAAVESQLENDALYVRRERIAVAAMQGILANPAWDAPAQRIASEAVTYANALMEALDKQ